MPGLFCKIRQGQRMYLVGFWHWLKAVELCAEGVGHMDKGLQGCTNRQWRRVKRESTKKHESFVGSKFGRAARPSIQCIPPFHKGADWVTSVRSHLWLWPIDLIATSILRQTLITRSWCFCVKGVNLKETSFVKSYKHCQIQMACPVWNKNYKFAILAMNESALWWVRIADSDSWLTRAPPIL